MSSYAPLTRHLSLQSENVVRLSFAEVESIIGRKLPRSAATHRAFWSNNASNNVMTRAWLAAGFQSEQVDLPGQSLVFRRVEGRKAMSGFEEAKTPFITEPADPADRLALFGWMKGTITIAPGVDLTDPLAPDWDVPVAPLDEPAA